MAEISAISWTDSTFNPWIGCTKVGPACDGCYAEALMGEAGRMKRVTWGKPGQRATHVRTAPSNWKQPVKWERQRAKALDDWLHGADNSIDPPAPHFVFCASLADVFDNAVDPQWRRDLFDLIRGTPHLTWLMLTKRPQNIIKLWSQTFADESGEPLALTSDFWPRNAAIGFTAVTQPEMDRDSRHALAAYRALNPAFLFWSGEPLLERVIIPDDLLALGGQFWAITGGETDQGAHKARPSHPDWFRQIRDQCAAAGVPYHHKQNGEWVGYCTHVRPDTNPREIRRDIGPTPVFRVGKKAAGRLLDGVTHDARPVV